jgi:16S rRNA (guanine(966)-N(2))-methyltransferase RsmD
MRIIAGEFRRRLIESPPDDATTRPIPDRVKESLFGILRGNCEGANVFDGFAGTGAIGLEAISRGAARCTFVERDKKMSELLRRNIENLGVADRCDIMTGDALGAGALARAPRPLTLAFLDPPYPVMEEPVGCQRVFAQMAGLIKLLAPDGFAILRTPWPLQHPILPEAVPEAPKMRGGKYAEKYKGIRTPGPKPKRVDDWKREKRLWEKGQDPKALKKRSKPAAGAGDVEWFEGDEVELLLKEQADQQAALAAAAPQWKTVDLTIPGAVGPETHLYRGMAIHFYAKQ